MAKLLLSDLTNLQNETSATNTINSNSEAIEDAIQNTLSRDGTSPNAMGATLDMNSNRIINLPAPSVSTEPARLADIVALEAGGTIEVTIPFTSLSVVVPVAGDYLIFGDVSDSELPKKATAADVWTVSKSPASATETGVVELATDAEAIAKTDTTRALIPSNLAALGSSTTFAGLTELATSAETITGTDTARAVTPAGGAAAYQVLDPQLSSLIRQNSQSAAYTTVLTDSGKHILHPTADNNARVFTIDSNANVAYAIGTAITFVNQINTVTIAITSDTMTLYPTGATGSRTLAANGIATALKIGTTSWVISGTGIT